MSTFHANSIMTEDHVTDTHWLSRVLGITVNSVTVEDMSGSGGMSGHMRRLRIVSSDNEETTYVLKSTQQRGLEQSKQLGLAREGKFYCTFYEHFKEILPVVKYSHGDLESGEKFILFEDLSDSVQTGYYFGPHSPLNWGKDLNAEKKDLHDVTLEMILEGSMMLAARYHGMNWKNASLLADDMSWLRGSAWIKGRDETGWQGGQSYVKHCWMKTKAEKFGQADYKVKWSPYMIELIDTAMDKLSWIHFQERIQNAPWTLVHGDFHPANMMWRPDDKCAQVKGVPAVVPTTEPEADGNERGPHHSHVHHRHQLHNLVLLDWEVVGIGSGAQDLGQYFISHLHPIERRKYEERMIRLYYAQLLSYGVQTEEYTYEMCWKEYVEGGSERWIWLLALMTQMCPDNMIQYFHDQVEAFARDHHVTPHNVGMPRL